MNKRKCNRSHPLSVFLSDAMLFHPSFSFAREHRLIFKQNAPAAQPDAGEAPKAELTPERQKAQEVIAKLKEKLGGNPKNLNVIRELAEEKFAEAEGNEEAFQQVYKNALEKAANAYFKTLDGTDEVKAKKVNELFQGAGAPGVRFEGGALVVGAEAPAEGKKEERELTQEEQDMIDQAFSSNPKLKAAAEKLLTALTAESPEYDTALGFFNTFNSKKPNEKVAILNSEQAFRKFMKELPPDQQKFVDSLRQNMTEPQRELSDEEKENILDGARQELNKFDLAKASEIDKNIMLGRLQMRGIDVSNGEEILKDPSKMKVFEGSPMERGFNIIMGLLTYLLASIEKMKNAIKPGAKKGAETPTGDKGKKGPEISPDKTALREKLREQSKKDSKTLSQVHGEKQMRLAKLQNTEIPSLRAKIQEIHDANAEAGLKDEDNAELQANKGQLEKAEAESAGLQSEIGELDVMKTEATALSHTLNESKNIIVDLLPGLPEGERKTQLIRALAFVVEPNEQFQLKMKPAAPKVDMPVFKKQLNAVLAGRLVRTLTEMIHFDGEDVLKTPAELTQVLQDLTQNVRAELQNKDKPAPAVPAGPMPAPGTAPPAAPPVVSAPGTPEGAGKK